MLKDILMYISTRSINFKNICEDYKEKKKLPDKIRVFKTE